MRLFLRLCLVFPAEFFTFWKGRYRVIWKSHDNVMNEWRNERGQNSHLKSQCYQFGWQLSMWKCDCIAFSKNHLITWSMTYVILLCGPITLSYNLLKLMATAQEQGWSQSFLGISRDLVIDTPSGLEDIISLQQVI